MPALGRRALFALPVALPVMAVAAAAAPMRNGAWLEFTELRGQLKPLVFGRALNVEPTLVDPSRLTYCAHHGRVDDIEAVRDGGVELRNMGDYPDWDALNEGAEGLPRGTYATCLAEGLLRLGWPPHRRLTVDVEAT